MRDTHQRRLEIVVGMFVLAAIAGLIYLSFRIGGGRPAQAATYDFIFDSALGLQVDNMVTVAGVRVGLVEEIGVEGRRAKVRVAIDRDLTLHRDATAAVRARTLLGEKYVDLVPGSETEPLLPPGSLIEHTVPTVEIDTVIRSAEEVISRANMILPPLQTAATTLEQILGKVDLEETARNLTAVLQEATELLRNTSKLARTSGEDLQVLIGQLRRRGPDILARLENTTTQIDKLVAAVPAESLTAAIERTPHAVAGAEKAMAELREAVAELQQMSQQGSRIAVSLDRLLRRLEEVDEQALREFLQVQGFRVNLTADPRVLRRLRELKNRALPAPLPEETGEDEE